MSIHLANSLTLSEILVKIKQTPHPSHDPETIEMVSTYLKDHKQDYTTFDARRWIEIMSMSQESTLLLKGEFDLIKRFGVIKHPSLLHYLKQQKIPLWLAQKYLSELKVFHPSQKKHSFVLGFPHDKEGFVINNQLMNGWVGDPSLTFIRGQETNSGTIHILKDVWDFLSLLAHLKNKDLQTDTIILNSYENITQVKAYLYQYGYRKAYTWLGNDKAGNQATRALSSLFRQEENLIHISMNAFYQPFPHFKDWYQQQAHN